MNKLRALIAIAASACLANAAPAQEPSQTPPMNTETITLGAGCFWCIEAVLQRIDGVESAISGYMGGTTQNPTYEQISTGRTGHAEVVQVAFRPDILTLETLLAHFWALHDPTTLNRQGADVGTQYRSAIFYHNERQRHVAEASMAAENASGRQPGPIVTQVAPATQFYTAENYHQDFYDLNKTHPYCRMVIAPKLQKLGLK